MNIHNTEFIKSAAASKDLIRDGLPQIAFTGKSNVGKSSVINRLLCRRNFARVSSSPGKTIHINYFLIDNSMYFVDLPGYGYARTAKTTRDRWAVLMEAFFAEPERISCGIMIVDARHKPTGGDETMARWFKSSCCPIVIVANKIDKVKNSEKDLGISLIRETLDLREDTRIIPFSAEKGLGREALFAEIERVVD